MKQLKSSANYIQIVVLIAISCCETISIVNAKETIDLIDDVYNDCQDDRKLNQICYGWSFADDYRCLKSANCEYLVLVDIFTLDVSKSPLISDVPSYVNIGDEELEINLYILQPESNVSYNVWLTNDQENYLYQCKQDDSPNDPGDDPKSTTTWKSVKKVNPVTIPGTDSFIRGCSWSVSQRNAEWPLNEKHKPIDLFNSLYWLVLGRTLNQDTKSPFRVLPIYHWKYLYQGCDGQSKLCYGANDCVNNFSCSELLVVKLREYDNIYLDFLFLFLEPLEKMSYTIDIKPVKRVLSNYEPNGGIENQQTISGQSISLRSQCDQTSCRHKMILPNDTLEIKIDDNLLAHSYNQLIGSSRKYIWSLPLAFEIDREPRFSFNGKNTMTQVTIKSNNLTLIESKIPGLPGYSLREDIYKECETINRENEQSASSSICYGFNKDNQRSECLTCSTCSMIAILKPLLTPISDNSSHHGIAHEAIELQLYGQDVPQSIGLYFIYNNEDKSSFGYQCLTKIRENKLQLKEIKLIERKETRSGQKITQNANVAFGSIYCHFIISGAGGSWPLRKNGETINLIRDEIPIAVTWNHYSYLVDPNGSRNPIHRFRFIYNSCSKKENVLCIGFDDCIAHRNCTNLIVIKYEGTNPPSSKQSSTASRKHRKSSSARGQEEESHGLLKWAVYSVDSSDSLVVSFSGDNLYGDDYAITCTPNGFTEHYIWETGKLKPIRETVIRDTKRIDELIPGSGLGGFRCFWTMPGLFSVFFQNYRFDVITDTVYMNLTFKKDKQPTHATRIFTTLPGFRSTKDNSGSTCHLSHVIKVLSVLLLIAVNSLFH